VIQPSSFPGPRVARPTSRGRIASCPAIQLAAFALCRFDEVAP
jgi:hypothetical protein